MINYISNRLLSHSNRFDCVDSRAQSRQRELSTLDGNLTSRIPTAPKRPVSTTLPIVVELDVLLEQAAFQPQGMMHRFNETAAVQSRSFRQSKSSDLSPSLEISALRWGSHTIISSTHGERLRYSQSARGLPRSPAFAGAAPSR